MKTNNIYEVLTRDGFKSFSGVSCQISVNVYKIITESFNEIVATDDHMFQLEDDSYISVKDLFLSNDNIKLKTVGSIIDISKLNEELSVYDILDVRDTNSFIANNFISHNCDFIGSAQTLISSEILLGLVAREPIKIQYGINYIIEPIEEHNYVMTVDVSKGRGQDYSTFSIFDISTDPFEQVCTFRDNLISPLIFPEIIVRAAKIYNNSVIVIENNDAGQVVCNAVYYDYEYDNVFVQSSVKASGIGVTMSKRVKRVGCSNLKDLLEQGKLSIHDANTIIELTSFEPKGDSYAASGTNHDDMVMNLVLFAWFVSTDAFGNMSTVDLKNLLYAEKIREMEEDVLPFGILTGYDASPSPAMEFYAQARADLEEWGTL